SILRGSSPSRRIPKNGNGMALSMEEESKGILAICPALQVGFLLLLLVVIVIVAVVVSFSQGSLGCGCRDDLHEYPRRRRIQGLKFSRRKLADVRCGRRLGSPYHPPDHRGVACAAMVMRGESKTLAGPIEGEGEAFGVYNWRGSC
ncbi:hypothetical protein Dimus_037581, partial [Dionaea muscipula]